MNRTARIATGASAAVVVVGLLALTAPLVVPFLPQRVQVALAGAGTIDTVPGSVDDLFVATGLEGAGAYGDDKVTHAAVDHEYQVAAGIWPWALPPGWKFPENRGAADTPGHHWNGMGVKAAFSAWATASLDAVRSGGLTPDAVNDLLDQVQAATGALIHEGVLTDRRFIEDAVTPLRP